MAKAQDDCVAALTEAFAARKTLTEGEIKFVAERLRERFKKAPKEGNHDVEWAKVAKGLAEEISETARIERRNASINVVIDQHLDTLATIADQRYGDPS